MSTRNYLYIRSRATLAEKRQVRARWKRERQLAEKAARRNGRGSRR